MTALRSLSVLALALVLSGCFQTKTLVRLNADGSGTIEETVLMNSAMGMAVLFGASMGRQMGEVAEQPYSEADLRDRAETLGATFVRVEEQDILFGTGYVATYAFDDINDLRLVSDPSALFPEEMREQMGDDLDLGLDQAYTFAYANGALTIQVPQPDPEDFQEDEEDMLEEEIYDVYPGRDPKKEQDMRGMSEMEDGPGGDNAAAMAMVFRDMRFSMTIELPRDVAQTNASYLDGRTLTLYDMDFERLAEDPEAFDRLENLAPGGPADMSAAMRALSEIPGFSVEHEPTVTVSFR